MSRAMGSSCVFTCWGAASWHGGRVMLVFGARAAAGAGSCVTKIAEIFWKRVGNLPHGHSISIVPSQEMCTLCFGSHIC